LLRLAAYRDAQKGKKAAGSSSGAGSKSKAKEKATPTINIPARSVTNSRPESRMDVDEEAAPERNPNAAADEEGDVEDAQEEEDEETEEDEEIADTGVIDDEDERQDALDLEERDRRQQR
jgi:hypothetical protein